MCYKQRLCKPCDCKNGCNLPCGHISMSYMPNCQRPVHKQLLQKVEIQLLSFQNSYCFLLHYFTSMSSLAFWLNLPYHEVFVCYIAMLLCTLHGSTFRTVFKLDSKSVPLFCWSIHFEAKHYNNEVAVSKLWL